MNDFTQHPNIDPPDDSHSSAPHRGAVKTRNCGAQPQTARSGGNLLALQETHVQTESRALTNDADSAAINPTEAQTAFPGAPPSNTAPANYIERLNLDNQPYSTLLRFGVDSLYLTYPGVLASTWDQRLEGLKRAAQAHEEDERSNAQVKIGEHLFEVKDKGKGRFAYVLVDNCFHIQLSNARSTSLPLAYVQLSSELLSAISITEAEQRLRFIINSLGLIQGEAQISRVDLFADFSSPLSMDSWTQHSWITRAGKIWMHYEKRQFSGWSIGLGGVMGCRLYDKTLELEKSKKDYLKPLWRAHGWDEITPVWRLEFEFKRDALRELAITSINNLLMSLGGLWAYATGAWLRLTIPNPDDDNQSRWPNHPLWDELAAVPWDQVPAQPLARLRKARLPSDEALFINGLGGMTSFMAANGMTDLDEGFGEFLAHAQRFHQSRKQQTGKSFRGYIVDKVKLKAKKYNTLKNETRNSQREEQARIEQAARDYRKAKDGE